MDDYQDSRLIYMRFRIPLPTPALLFLLGALIGSFATLKISSSFLAPASVVPQDTESVGIVQGVSTDLEAIDKVFDIIGEEDTTVKTADVYIPEESDETTVTVIDGDTIKMADGEKVRYIGVNTPELKEEGKEGCLAASARAANERLVRGANVRMEDDVSDKDRYGRLLRYVWAGEVFINETLVAQGLAHATAYPPDTKYQKVFADAEQVARSLKLGMWGNLCADAISRPATSSFKTITELSSRLAPSLLPQTSSCNVKANISANGDKIYHLPGCKSYAKTVIREADGEQWFCSEEEARDAGWRKAKDCP